MVPTEEIAEEHGVTPSTVLHWKNAGCPHVPAAGREFYFEPQAVRDWLKDKPHLGKPGRPAKLIDGKPAADLLAEVKLRKELALAQRHEHNLARLKREVVPIEEVRTMNLRRIAECRANLLALPGKLAGRLVGLTEERLYAELELEMRALLARFAKAGDEVLDREVGDVVDRTNGNDQVIVA